MRRWRGLTVWGIVLLTLGLLTFAAWAVIGHYSQPTTTVTIGGTAFKASLARTDDELTRGLGGVTNLGANRAMLFVFKDDGVHAMWMKDMTISLDMIWIDNNHEVVHIAKNVDPSTYPKSFGSPKPARYVLEVNAGAATDGQIKVGNLASFDLPE